MVTAAEHHIVLLCRPDRVTLIDVRVDEVRESAFRDEGGRMLVAQRSLL